LATAERSAFEAECTRSLKALQTRAVPLALPSSAEEIWQRVRVTLQKAVRAELLKTSAHEVFRLLRRVGCTQRGTNGTYYEFSCGPTNDERKRPDSRDCLVRDDGAVLSFSVTLGEHPSATGLELLAYRYDLTFPRSEGPSFVRFDLDWPNQGHDKDGLRAHIHPGLKEGRLPSPILAPSEAIQFLLVHLRAC